MLMVLVCIVTFSVSVGTAEAKRGKTKSKQCHQYHTCSYIIESEGVTYSVTGGASYWRNCATYGGWPSWGCDVIKAEIIDRIGPETLSMSWVPACGNTHFYSATITSVPGVCGSAQGQILNSFPTTGLCSSGSIISTSTTDSSFNWVCAGSGGAQNKNCSASKSTDFSLSCSANPEAGVTGVPVDFAAAISGTTTATSAFTFIWNVDGVDYPDNENYSHTFNQATATVSVKVTASKGTVAKQVTCPINRINCTGGQYYCGDATNSTSFSCAPTQQECPNSACGSGYDISLDKELDTNSTLSITNPSSSYISTNSLCASGSTLRYISGISSWMFSASYSMWRWECKNASATNIATCKARCKTGEYFCLSQSKCVPETSSCNCQLVETGATVDQRSYCVDDRTNSCYACGQVVKYFKLNPNEVLRDTPQRCGAYWESNETSPSELPENTTNTRVICEIKTGSGTVSVAANNPEGGSAYQLPIGSHELTCKQQYQISGDTTWKDLMASSMPTKCRALPGVIER